MLLAYRAAQANPSFGTEDTVTLSATVRPGGADGGAALLTASWNFASSEGGGPDWLVITGTKATLRLTVADTSTPLEVVSRSGTQKIEFDTPRHIQQPMIQTVVRAWPGLEVSPVMHIPAPLSTMRPPPPKKPQVFFGGGFDEGSCPPCPVHAAGQPHRRERRV